LSENTAKKENHGEKRVVIWQIPTQMKTKKKSETRGGEKKKNWVMLYRPLNGCGKPGHREF